MQTVHFETPWALLLLFFLPLVAGWLPRKLKSEDTASIRFSSPVPVCDLPVSFRARIRNPLLSVLQALGFVSLVIALARPQTGTQFTEIEESGRDIVLALDVSGSMQALDFELEGKRVNRLSALKSVVKKFADRRRGDRLGITIFGTEAFTQCPLTTDSETVKSFIDMLEIGMTGKGTAIGSGLAVALKQIRSIENNSKVVILVTDGKSNSGTLSPQEAAQIAAKMKVKIYTIGIGGEGYAPFPTESFFGRTVLVNQRLEYDEKTLRELAAITGGKYFLAKDTEKLESIYAEIDTLEERQEKSLQYIEYEEEFFPFALTGFVLLLIGQVLTGTVLLKVP